MLKDSSQNGKNNPNTGYMFYVLYQNIVYTNYKKGSCVKTHLAFKNESSNSTRNLQNENDDQKAGILKK